MTEWGHPALLYFIGAVFIPFLEGRARQVFLVAVPALAILNVATLAPGTFATFTFLGREVILGQVDKLSIVFAWVFTIASLIGMVYALHVRKPGEHVAAYIYVGGSLGVVFAGDFLSLFLFWEIMAFASAYLVFAQGGRLAVRAGFRYLMVHITGGVILVGGIVLYTGSTGSTAFGLLDKDGGPGFYLILAGFMLNAAVPPLSAWLTDAYPEATITGAVFMSAFTTKTAIYVLLRAFPGTELLVWMGAIMTLYGVVYAFLENDCRRLLAYHIVSQVGYMVTGVGLGTEIGVNGSASHAFAHIIYKGLLFMGAGAVIYMTGRRKLTEMGGLYRAMPITFGLYMVGALAISAFPLFSGFISKSMVVAAANQDHRAIIALMLVMASSGTFLSVGIKLPYYMFFSRPAPTSGRESVPGGMEPPLNMLIAMGLAAFLSVAIGVFPNTLYVLLPHPVDFEPYTGDHVTGSLGILMFTLLGFVLFLRRLGPENTISIDTDWFYRKGARLFMWLAEKPIAAYEGVVAELSNTVVLRSLHAMARASFWTDLHVVDAIVNGVAYTAMSWGRTMRKLQTGLLTQYAIGLVVGAMVGIAIYSVVGM